MDKQDEILIKIISEGEEQLISTCKNEYRSLMVLIKDKLYPDGFGECGGLGRCATCIVRLEKEITGMERNESTTLSKQGIANPYIRLSCQLLVDASLHDCTVIILNND